MDEAIRRFVRDGDSVYIGGFIHGEPYAAIHEIIRQGKRDLTLSCGAATIFADQLIGAGCVRRLITSYCWNPVPDAAHAFRRAVEHSIPCPVELQEYSLLGLSLAYFAGALDLPFVATKSMLGTGFLEHPGFLGDAKLRVMDSPFGDGKVCLVGPLRHDVGIVQLQRADRFGNAQAWGLLGPTKYGLHSCQRVIVCVEELVDEELIFRDPSRTILPGFRVCAVVEEPWGAHPSYVQGYYDRDWRFAAQYAKATASLEGFTAHLQEWVLGVKDRKAYLETLGRKRLAALKGRVRKSGVVNYGLYDRF
jgi:glutaconate CoA-transferase subunit A